MLPYFFSVDDPCRSIGYLLRRAFQLSQAVMEPLYEEEGLSGPQWPVLALIGSGRCETCAELGRDLIYDKGAMTRLLDTLEVRGWVVRCRDDGDRRIVKLALTEAGAALNDRVRDRVIGRWNDWLDDWDQQEIETLILGLQKLHHSVEKRSMTPNDASLATA